MGEMTILDVLRRRAWMVVVISLIATISGYGFCFLLDEQFEASTLLLVRPQQSIKLDKGNMSKDFMDYPLSQSAKVETPSKTYIEIIKSRELIERVVRTLALDKSAEDTGVVAILRRWLRYLISLVKYGKIIEEDPLARAIRTVEDNLSLKATDDTYIFEVKYKSKDPQTAANVSNTVAELFIELMDEARQSEVRHVREQLQAQLKISHDKLDAARQLLEDYKKKHSIFLYETEYSSKLKVIADLEVELAKSEATLDSSQNTLSRVSWAARRARLMSILKERKAELVSLPRIEHELKQLEANVTATEAAYDIVDKGLKEADIKFSYATPEVWLVSHAGPPQLPSGPRRATITAASLLAGVVTAIGLAALLEFMNREVRNIHDVEDCTGLRVLATIPRISRRRWRLAGL